MHQWNYLDFGINPPNITATIRIGLSSKIFTLKKDLAPTTFSKQGVCNLNACRSKDLVRFA